MKHILLYGLSIIFILILSGCIETQDEFIINPDGTGKVIHQAVLQQVDFQPDTAARPSLENRNKKNILAELEKAQGIDAWRDVSWEDLGNDKLAFKGTAYFKDVSKLKFYNSGFSFSLFNKIKLQRQDKSLVLTVESDEGSDKGDAFKKNTLSENTAPQTQESEKEQTEKAKMMISDIFSTLKIKKTFILPGRRVSSNNFEISDHNKITLNFEGDKLVSVLTRLIDSGQWTKDDPDIESEVLQTILGNHKMATANYMEADTPFFDYSKEISRIVPYYQALLKSLDAVMTQKADPSSAAFHVGGIRMVFESDSDNHIRPFNYDKGLTLSILGKLPQKVLKAKDGEIRAAMADDGQDLLPDSDWDRKINFPKISLDQTTLIFDADLKLPSPTARSIKRLEGTIRYLSAASPKTVDLGIHRFAAGEQGGSYNAIIREIKKSQWQPEKQQMDLKLDISVDRVKEIRLFDEHNALVEFSKGHSYSDDVVTFHLVKAEGDFPENGRIEIVVYEDLKQFELPFELKDLPLPGRVEN